MEPGWIPIRSCPRPARLRDAAWALTDSVVDIHAEDIGATVPWSRNKLRCPESGGQVRRGCSPRLVGLQPARLHIEVQAKALFLQVYHAQVG